MKYGSMPHIVCIVKLISFLGIILLNIYGFFFLFFHFYFPVLRSGGVETNIQTWSTRPQSQPTQYHVHTTMLCKDDIINVDLS